MNTHFAHAITYRRYIAGISKLQPINAGHDSTLRARVGQIL